MSWKVEYTDEFETWWQQLDSAQLESVAVTKRVTTVGTRNLFLWQTDFMQSTLRI